MRITLTTAKATTTTMAWKTTMEAVRRFDSSFPLSVASLSLTLLWRRDGMAR